MENEHEMQEIALDPPVPASRDIESGAVLHAPKRSESSDSVADQCEVQRNAAQVRARWLKAGALVLTGVILGGSGIVVFMSVCTQGRICGWLPSIGGGEQ